MGTLQSGFPLPVGFIDASTNAGVADRNAHQCCKTRSAVAYGCSRLRRSHRGAREPSKRIDRGHNWPAGQTPLKSGALGRYRPLVLSVEADEACMTYKSRLY